MKAVSATFEPLCEHAGMVRVHLHAHALVGDPYVWFTAALAHPHCQVELKGTDRRLPHGGAQAVCDALRAAGFTRRLYTRIKDGHVRIVSKPLGD